MTGSMQVQLLLRTLSEETTRPVAAVVDTARTAVPVLFASTSLLTAREVGPMFHVSACALEIAADYGKKMLKMAEHGAIAVNGDLYEYSQQGLVSISGELADDMRQNFPKVFALSSDKSEADFFQWFRSEPVKTKYTRAKYSVCTNNCIHFVKDACAFLGIEMPRPFQQILNLCQRAQPIARGLEAAAVASGPEEREHSLAPASRPEEREHSLASN